MGSDKFDQLLERCRRRKRKQFLRVSALAVVVAAVGAAALLGLAESKPEPTATPAVAVSMVPPVKQVQREEPAPVQTVVASKTEAASSAAKNPPASYTMQVDTNYLQSRAESPEAAEPVVSKPVPKPQAVSKENAPSPKQPSEVSMQVKNVTSVKTLL